MSNNGDFKIFGYNFSDIQRAQRGGCLGRPIIDSSHGACPATKSDLSLLERYGVVELDKMGYGGVLDRLRRSGLID